MTSARTVRAKTLYYVHTHTYALLNVFVARRTCYRAHLDPCIASAPLGLSCLADTIRTYSPSVAITPLAVPHRGFQSPPSVYV